MGKYYGITELLPYRKEMAMRTCGIYDPEEVGELESLSYMGMSGNHSFVTVWMFGNKKIYSAMVELLPGNWEDPTGAVGIQYFDVYRFKNLSNIRVDNFGCVLTMNTGKKIELMPSPMEGADQFQMSMRGLVRLWDEYCD